SLGHVDSLGQELAILLGRLLRLRLDSGQHYGTGGTVCRQVFPRGNCRRVGRAETAPTPKRGYGGTASRTLQFPSLSRRHCRPAVVLAGVHHPLLRSLQGGGNFRRWASPSDASATNASPPHSFALRQRVGQKAHRIGKLFLLNQGVKERRRRLAVL